MKLSKRLQTLHDMVKGPCIVADIGCDHGLLPIALIQSQTCRKAYACDINIGPLMRAKNAIHEAHLEEQIEAIQCNGIDDLNDDVTIIVIAGMGYDTITSILSSNIHKLKRYKQILIQCNTHVDKLRYWLSQHGFYIDHEELIKDTHYYQMLSVHMQQQFLNEEQCVFGLYLDNHPLFISYWTAIMKKQKTILKELDPKHIRFGQTLHKIQLIENKIYRNKKTE